MRENLKLAIQKKGRLTEKTIELLKNCGLDIENYSDRLMVPARNFPIDLIFLRDDDIPEYVQDGVTDIGIVGENILFEKNTNVDIGFRLGYSKCKLTIAVPEAIEYNSIAELNNKRIATSYPVILKNFLMKNNINAKIIDISGSVEVAPSLGITDLICDIVSTGNTLRLHKLKPFIDIFNSEAVLIKNLSLEKNNYKQEILSKLLLRIESAIKAKKSKYIMMNIPKESLDIVSNIIPSLKSPTILPLADESMLAVHAVIPSDQFWEINDKLKDTGASGILLIPIENMIL